MAIIINIYQAHQGALPSKKNLNQGAALKWNKKKVKRKMRQKSKFIVVLIDLTWDSMQQSQLEGRFEFEI